MNNITQKELDQAIADWQELRDIITHQYSDLHPIQLCAALQGHNWNEADQMFDVDFKSILAVIKNGKLSPRDIEVWNPEGTATTWIEIDPETCNLVIDVLKCRPTHQAVVNYLCNKRDVIPTKGCVDIAFDCGYSCTIQATSSLVQQRECDIANDGVLSSRGDTQSRGWVVEVDRGTYIEDREAGRLCFVDRKLRLCPTYKTYDVWQKYTPKFVELYYVDRDEDLSGHMNLLQRCVEKNCLDGLYEHVWDWWVAPEMDSLHDISKEMKEDLWDEEYEACEEEIREWLFENDTSDPAKSLLDNTGELTCYYSLGVEVDGWHTAFMCTPWRGETEAQAAYKVRRALHISKGSDEGGLVSSIIANAGGGGELRIYFTADLNDMLCKQGDFTSITFKGQFAVGVINSGEGSGDFEHIQLDLTLPFKRENLSISEADKHSLEDIFGMCSDWCKSDNILFGTKLLKSKRKVPTSKMAAERAKEAEYDRVFKAGGCTRGDMDYSRHRNVYYDNTVPCGSRCPHCGTFWID